MVALGWKGVRTGAQFEWNTIRVERDYEYNWSGAQFGAQSKWSAIGSAIGMERNQKRDHFDFMWQCRSTDNVRIDCWCIPTLVLI